MALVSFQHLSYTALSFLSGKLSQMHPHNMLLIYISARKDSIVKESTKRAGVLSVPYNAALFSYPEILDEVKRKRGSLRAFFQSNRF